MKRRVLYLVFVMLFLCFAAGCVTNPVTGKQEFMLLGSGYEQDISIGESTAAQVEKNLGGTVENWQVQHFVNSVGQTIAQRSHAPQLEFKYTVLKNDIVNAFALPGGYIYITSGMLKKFNSEAQLAAVLAHETAHVTARHAAANMSRDMLIDLGVSALATQEIDNAMRVVRVAAQLEGLHYSREQEAEADQIGLDYMVKAGYNPQAMIETMEMLERENAIRQIEFLSSHPSPQNRRQKLQNLIRHKGYVPSGKEGIEDYQRHVLNNLR